MSGSNICDGLETTLVAASAFDAGNVSTNDYGILDSVTACALIVKLGGLRNNSHAYGKPSWDLAWELRIEVYLRDLGSVETLNNMKKVTDEILGAVQTDTTLNSSACGAIVSSATMPRDTMAEFGGQTWLPVDVVVTAMEVM